MEEKQAHECAHRSTSTRQSRRGLLRRMTKLNPLGRLSSTRFTKKKLTRALILDPVFGFARLSFCRYRHGLRGPSDPVVCQDEA